MQLNEDTEIALSEHITKKDALLIVKDFIEFNNLGSLEIKDEHFLMLTAFAYECGRRDERSEK